MKMRRISHNILRILKIRENVFYHSVERNILEPATIFWVYFQQKLLTPDYSRQDWRWKLPERLIVNTVMKYRSRWCSPWPWKLVNKLYQILDRTECRFDERLSFIHENLLSLSYPVIIRVTLIWFCCLMEI